MGEDQLKDMSDRLTEESDVRVTGVDTIETRGPEVEGNEVTVRAYGDGGEGTLLGFDQEQYEHFVDRLVVHSERDWVVFDDE